MKLSDVQRNGFSKYIKDKYDLEDFFIYETNDTITLHSLIVKKGKRNLGVGTSVMKELVSYADKKNKMLFVTPALRDQHWGTTSRKRLVKFYKRFGFVENKGRNKDFRYNADIMYRISSRSK